ncbi:MAG TPA: hypothetical protein PK165_00865 [bacterium]|nr:hypothetical protein [bacterium]HPO51366.1 hypothetical protein [bacterium]
MAERYELGQLLLMKGVITQEQLEEALVLQKKRKSFWGRFLLKMAMFHEKHFSSI